MCERKGDLKMTFEQAFLKVKEKFDKADAKNVADFAIQVTFSDEDCGGTFYAEVKDGKLNVEPYDYHDNDAALTISKSALLSVLSGRSSLDKAIAKGEAAVYGDASKVADWKSTISKKAPAKKTAAKKTETKKAAPAKKTAAKKVAPAKKAAPTKKAEAKAETKTTAVKPVAPATKSAMVKTETKIVAPVEKTTKKN